MNVEILIITYQKDAQWLDCCLRSITKYTNGFSGVTVVYPYRDTEVLAPICNRRSVVTKQFAEAEGKGHLHQNALKCFADHYCPKADYIAHIDSDCLFVTASTPQSFFAGAKPIILTKSYDSLRPKADEITPYVWKAPTERALGFGIDLEFMSALPIILARSVYEQVRGLVSRNHGVPFIDYVLGCKPNFPYGFCEFNALGAWAHRFTHDDYIWQDVDAIGMLPLDYHVWHLWSHGGRDYVHPRFGSMRQGDIIDLIMDRTDQRDVNPFTLLRPPS